jgi:HAD superfamily hydrolase (TIGR01450 family)
MEVCMLGSSDRSLCDAYDLAMLDLDGVVYVGGDAVPGAPDHLAAVRDAGMRLAFITNNAARPPAQVAEHLRELGVAAQEADVVTSAQAAARLLVDRLGAGSQVALLGGDGLEEALVAEGLKPVSVHDEADAIVSGYGPDVIWRDVMQAAVRIRDGLLWVASNTDRTFPTPYGLAPGHGVLVQTLSSFSEVDPVVAGKPERPLLDETVRRVGGDRPLMVGDRLDTDIAGARNAGLDSLLVMTGVTGLAELVAATPEERPTYVAADLAGLLETQAAPELDGGDPALGGWQARVESGRLTVSGEGSASDWWRVVASAAWQHLDDSGDAVDVEGVRAPLA